MEAVLDHANAATGAVPKLVHVAFYAHGCPPPPRSLCGAPITRQVPGTTPVDCVVCASLLGVGE